MKHATWLPLFLLGACAGPTQRAPAMWSGSIESWGTLREALRDGEVEGRVALSDVAHTGTYGVGALEGLRGEVTIIDGEVWVSEGSPAGAPTTRTGSGSALATVLFAAEVHAWSEVAVLDDVDPSELDAFIAASARSVGIDPARPFPFMVEGELCNLDLHVIAGACPIRARMLGEASTASELHMDRVNGRLVGIYAPDSAGVVCQMGTKLHAHALIERDGGLTGHVESVGIAGGSVLKLPQQGR